MRKSSPTRKRRVLETLTPLGRTWLRLLLSSLLVALFVAESSRPVCADLCTQFGLSPRAIGMGNAVSAVIEDFSGFYYNPAALSASSGNSFTVGYYYSSPRVKIRDRTGAEFLAHDAHTNTGVFGYRQNLRGMFPESWGRNIVVALGLAFPGDLKKATYVRTSLYDEPQFPVFGRVPDMLVMGGGLSVEVLPGMVYLGVGMRFAVTYDATNLTRAHQRV